MALGKIKKAAKKIGSGIKKAAGTAGGIIKAGSEIAGMANPWLGIAGGVMDMVGGHKDAKQAASDSKWAKESWQKSYDQTERWNQKQLEEAQRQYNQQRADSLRTIQHRVADAQAAGLHPLYAMGASANVSPTSFMPGQTAQGSLPKAAQGSAYSRMGDGMRQLMGPTDMEKAQLNAINASASRDEAEALYYASRANTEAQIANSRQDGGHALGHDAIVTPYGSVQPGPHTPQQEVEDQYGGVVGEIYGVSRALGETAQHVTSQAKKARLGHKSRGRNKTWRNTTQSPRKTPKRFNRRTLGRSR
jgi:hypothetical protein